MDTEALIKQLIRDALAADNARSGRSVQLKPGLKKYSKQVKSLGNFADEALYEELQSLQASTPWLNHLKPDAIEVVEGVKSIRFTIDLACHEALAQYADYTQMSRPCTGRNGLAWLRANTRTLNLLAFYAGEIARNKHGRIFTR